MSKYKIAVLAPNGYEDSERGQDLINFASKEKDRKAKIKILARHSTDAILRYVAEAPLKSLRADLGLVDCGSSSSSSKLFGWQCSHIKADWRKAKPFARWRAAIVSSEASSRFSTLADSFSGIGHPTNLSQ